MNSSEFEIHLTTVLDRHLAVSTPENLAAAIRYSLLAPGRRIRPRLTFASANLLGISESSILPAAIALEMAHCFTLVHDDLPCMDDDDYRRGLPTNHKKFGEKIALLAGDALMTLAFEVLLETPPQYELSSQSATTALAAREIALKRFVWALGPRGVIGGQAAESKLELHPDLAQLKQMHVQKTGALFAAAVLIPMDFAGISEKQEQGRELVAFADALGLAFQAADDLEDPSDCGPTSILHYLSAAQACETSIQALRLAYEALERQWGQKAKALIAIAQEVCQKIENSQ